MVLAMARPGRQDGTELVEKPKVTSKRPQLFHVVLLNDDYTTMEFVVHVLESVFAKGPAEANRIMMEVHTKGRGVCGAYTFEIAETKVATVHDLARAEGFPLRAGIEEA
jgi:ATP-dependent Clp protease adaptor protein ClpS